MNIDFDFVLYSKYFINSTRVVGILLLYPVFSFWRGVNRALTTGRPVTKIVIYQTGLITTLSLSCLIGNHILIGLLSVHVCLRRMPNWFFTSTKLTLKLTFFVVFLGLSSAFFTKTSFYGWLGFPILFYFVYTSSLFINARGGQLNEESPLQNPHTKPALKVIRLRSKPNENLAMDDVKKMCIRNGFHDLNMSRSGEGIQHDYEVLSSELVIDRITGLTWQQCGSDKNMTFQKAQKYVQERNSEKYAGYSDWRLPTLEEGMSLLEKNAVGILLHIDPIFARKQWMIWTADKLNASSAWVVSFDHGYCHYNDVDYYRFYVRAVRSGSVRQ